MAYRLGLTRSHSVARPETGTMRHLSAGKLGCGEYSVLLGVSMNNDTERRKYMRTFTLSIERNGKAQLHSNH